MLLRAIEWLRWADVDPATRSLDAGLVRELARGCLAGSVERFSSAEGVDRVGVQRCLDLRLVEGCGAWVVGWRWAASEPGGGGPVRAWCCEAHSLLPEAETDPAPTLERVVEAVSQWHAFLCELSRTFEILRDETADATLESGAERAAARLLPLVLERTQAEDAWYQTFTRVVSWYLESAGYDTAVVHPVVAELVSGRFESWIAPGDRPAAELCAALGREVVAAQDETAGQRDALDAWMRGRGRIIDPGHVAASDRPVTHDAHRDYIDRVDRKRDPDRGDRMAAALQRCRASARRGDALTFELLQAWQALVLDEAAPPFRTAAAYAKGGRDVYGWDPSTPRRFARCLAEANDPGTPWAVAAARVYLDVCFFHPFADGNARAARLALDHVLTRASRALGAVEPVFLLPRAADDPHGVRSLASVLVYLCGPADFSG